MAEQQTGDSQTSNAFVDVNTQGQRITQENKERNDNINKQLLENKNNTNILQNILTKSANPSPIYIVLLTIFVLVILWMLHYIFIKPKLTGEWYPDAGNDVWHLKHKFMSNEVSVKINEKDKGHLKAIDNLIMYNNILGIWNYENTVIFTNGLILTRSLN